MSKLDELVPRFEPVPVKIDIGKIKPDPKIFIYHNSSVIHSDGIVLPLNINS